MQLPESLQKESGGLKRVIGEFGTGLLYVGFAVGTVALLGAELFALQDSLQGRIPDALASE